MRAEAYAAFAADLRGLPQQLRAPVGFVTLASRQWVDVGPPGPPLDPPLEAELHRHPPSLTCTFLRKQQVTTFRRRVLRGHQCSLQGVPWDHDEEVHSPSCRPM
ncbi:hypothetical protein COCOBI_16-1000 [Coccomyxa sp. Obi]|nr:hypothetical protein COCOBI_16-1000 [Coccomyxa sp. Obi]